MINEELYEYINFNINTIYANIHTVFDISIDEFKRIIISIMTIGKDDSFYGDLIKPSIISKCFDKTNLTKLKTYLSNIRIKSDTIKEMIIDTPEILLFSDKAEAIFPIFKSHDFKGYVLVHNDKYKSYEYSEALNIYYNIVYNEELKKYETKKEYKKNHFYENDTIVKSMLELITRKDVMTYYNLSKNSSLLDKFYALSSTYNKRNFYFYKENNPLIGIKAKLTTIGKDKKYHCDLCERGFDNLALLKTYHIKSIQDGGTDEVYNIACLCDKCYSLVNSQIDEEIYHEDLIMSLKLRMERTMPEYLNKIDSFFALNEKKR